MDKSIELLCAWLQHLLQLITDSEYWNGWAVNLDRRIDGITCALVFQIH